MCERGITFNEMVDLNKIYEDVFPKEKELARDIIGLPPREPDETPDVDLNELIEELTRQEDDRDVKTALDGGDDGCDPRKDTLVVNLFAGPGAGKSTTAAGVFYELKSRGVNCELAAEYAKDLVWEERHRTFEDQIYMFGKQYHRIFRLLGQVDVVVTDCPLLLTPIYDGEKRHTLANLAIDEHNQMWTYNAFIKRIKKFNPKGRLHDLEQAQDLDRRILDILNDTNQCFEVMEGNDAGKNKIVQKVLSLLEFNNIFPKK